MLHMFCKDILEEVAGYLDRLSYFNLLAASKQLRNNFDTFFRIYYIYLAHANIYKIVSDFDKLSHYYRFMAKVVKAEVNNQFELQLVRLCPQLESLKIVYDSLLAIDIKELPLKLTHLDSDAKYLTMVHRWPRNLVSLKLTNKEGVTQVTLPDTIIELDMDYPSLAIPDRVQKLKLGVCYEKYKTLPDSIVELEIDRLKSNIIWPANIKRLIIINNENTYKNIIWPNIPVLKKGLNIEKEQIAIAQEQIINLADYSYDY